MGRAQGDAERILVVLGQLRGLAQTVGDDATAAVQRKGRIGREKAEECWERVLAAGKDVHQMAKAVDAFEKSMALGLMGKPLPSDKSLLIAEETRRPVMVSSSRGGARNKRAADGDVADHDVAEMAVRKHNKKGSDKGGTSGSSMACDEPADVHMSPTDGGGVLDEYPPVGAVAHLREVWEKRDHQYCKPPSVHDLRLQGKLSPAAVEKKLSSVPLPLCPSGPHTPHFGRYPHPPHSRKASQQQQQQQQHGHDAQGGGGVGGDGMDGHVILRGMKQLGQQEGVSPDGDAKALLFRVGRGDMYQFNGRVTPSAPQRVRVPQLQLGMNGGAVKGLGQLIGVSRQCVRAEEDMYDEVVVHDDEDEIYARPYDSEILDLDQQHDNNTNNNKASDAPCFSPRVMDNNSIHSSSPPPCQQAASSVMTSPRSPRCKRNMKPIGPKREEDQYEVTDNEGQRWERLDEKESEPPKYVPRWAVKGKWRVSALSQLDWDPDSIFGIGLPRINLRAMFSSHEELFKSLLREHPADRPRRSSAVWIGMDKLTIDEVRCYRERTRHVKDMSHLVQGGDLPSVAEGPSGGGLGGNGVSAAVAVGHRG
ncbi:unnamed protein product [Vitrella brassicaformis CCMP3155]|uniref:Inner centromere protein ARK-binding domain-containing protein n=2 Tax=Vitrella brassicaformis TaxID=1169539 RepID=A0A0G4G2I7_VITBC|nr:unnamed protein product [Vitrella brassicaformis CCMP3155]|eukprot:CEM22483.1 unnamed protein product [Vitrella brassicaformis CCMP3155]